MHTPLHLRLMNRDDLPFADALRALAGWNQTMEDWRRFLDHEPNGCFLAEWNGAPAGTATTTVYGTTLAWIGMVLVHPDYRRRGIGDALLKRCLASLRERSVGCIKLDATPLGKRVYVNLGFEEEWTLTRRAHAGLPARPVALDSRIRSLDAQDCHLLEALDSAAFGAPRQKMLHTLISRSRCALAIESAPGRVAGYGVLRDGARASYLGPVVAESVAAGLSLIAALLARTEGRAVYWDLPDANKAAAAWAEEQGFVVQRPLTRMVLGESTVAGEVEKQFGLAGPETG